MGVGWAGRARAAGIGGEQAAQKAVELHGGFSLEDDAPMVDRRERRCRLIVCIASIVRPHGTQ